MIYITTKQPPRFHQITLDEILNGEVDVSRFTEPTDTNTRTFVTESASYDLLKRFDIAQLVNILQAFNLRYKELIDADKTTLYRSYHIPKRTGGLRRIDEPSSELKEAQICLRNIFQKQMLALYHTSAFAYVEGRSTVDAVRRHQRNESFWFGKIDFSDFFGSTTPDFVFKMITKIFPFSEIIKFTNGSKALSTALSICFLNGGLPQGSPISPMITNLMMIPIDHHLCNTLRKFDDYQKFAYGDEKQKTSLVYTRYADDILVSSKYSFDMHKVVGLISSTLKYFDAPFKINPKKTRYGSRAGRNWNLGVMLNKDNEITIGHKKKKYFKAMLSNYICDTLNGKKWSLHDVQVLLGDISYYRMIEKKYINHIISNYDEKYNVDVMSMIKDDIKNLV